MKYIWKPLITIIEKRKKHISDSLESIRTTQIQSQQAHDKALVCLQKAQTKAQAIIKHAHECKTKILHDAQYEAYKERDQILSKAQIILDQERKRVLNELRKKIGQLVIESTEKIINRSINEVIDHDFINTIIQTLPYED